MANHHSTLITHHFKMPVMAHLVLGFPNLEESLRTAETYIRAGVQVLELQIPFSHPTADGPIITSACQEAVRQGVTVRDCIGAIRGLREQYPEQEIMVMSYLNRVYTFGFQKFVDEMQNLGIRHLIIPDLPVDSLTAQDLTTFEKLSNLKLVPVLAANVSDARLEKLLEMGFDFFYLMSDFKITGSTFSLHPRLREVITRIKSHSSDDLKSSDERSHPSTNPQSTNPQSPRIGIGFGISTPEQARLVAEEADLAIIGSALIQAQRKGRLGEYLAELKNTFAAATERV